MEWLSFNLIVTIFALASIAHLVYELSSSFIPLSCTETGDCVTSSLRSKPRLILRIYISAMSDQMIFDHVYSEEEFNYSETRQMQILLPIPEYIHRYEALFLHVVLSSPRVVEYPGTYYELNQEAIGVHTQMKMTHYKIPEITPYYLLREEKKSNESMEHISSKPVLHLKREVTLMMVTDNIKLPAHNLPWELSEGVRITKDGTFWPILYYEFPTTSYSNSMKMSSSEGEAMNVTIHYTPISIEKLRFKVNFQKRFQLHTSEVFNQNLDIIERIFIDIEPYVLGVVIFVYIMRCLFEFLTSKYDVTFWESRKNLPGLSGETVLWRAFSAAVIFLYLFGEQCSLLVFIPALIRPMVTFWQSRKYLKAKLVTDQGWLPRIQFENNDSNSDEEETRKLKTKIITHLSHMLYPLVIGGAVYSLLYQPHKSWYSWGIYSLVNGIYAFDFLLMLPQLFVTHKLKTVPYLPWREIVCETLDIVIEDMIAFLIWMPTTHRVACFRDDAVFLVKLYQRWLYPVEESRGEDAVVTDKAPALHEMDDKKEK